MTASYLRLLPGHAGTLVCFPWAGAGALPFRPWASLAPEGLALVVSRPAGREDRLREPVATAWDPLIAQLVADLTVPPPYVFFGHCVGALTAFEVARELRRQGRAEPQRLLLTGAAPQLSGGTTGVVDVYDTVRRSGAVEPHLLDDPQIFPLIAPLIGADLTLAGRYAYRPEAPLNTPIDLFAAAGAGPPPADDVLGWSAVTTAPVRVHTVPGSVLYPHDAWQPLGRAVFAAAGWGAPAAGLAAPAAVES